MTSLSPPAYGGRVPGSVGNTPAQLAEIGLLEKLLGRQILQFDPTGNDYKIVEVFGDLIGARNLAVVVGGTNQGLHNWDSEAAPRARAIRNAAGKDDTAVIAWLGYDAPNSAFMGGQESPAREGGRRLASFVNGLSSFNAGARTTVIGHSYGSSVVGAAMASGLRAGNVVHTGSPGIGVNSIGETGYGGNVWVARGEGETGLFSVGSWIGVCAYTTCHEVNPHGPDPYDFAGVRRLLTDATGHKYFRPGSLSLEGIAGVVNGTARYYSSSGMWGAP